MVNKVLKEIIVNVDNTYTIKSREGWTLTANLKEIEETMNKCYNLSISNLVRKYHANNK